MGYRRPTTAGDERPCLEDDLNSNLPSIVSTFRTIAAAQYVGCSRSKLEKLRLYGDGPLFIKIGRTVVYRRQDLDAWLEMNTRNSTSEYR
ncbi:MAG: helix-turn-helix domain-containing protein [Magnetococcales bacterium]|nr:helix-turn-helix domain-containing protein [Magnetococcales bacterium]